MKPCFDASAPSCSAGGSGSFSVSSASSFFAMCLSLRMVRHASRRKIYARVVKEWFNSPAWAAFARQALPGAVGVARKNQEMRGFRAGTTAALTSAVTDQKGSGRPMDNTLLVSLSQQLAAYRSMDVIANNIANINTP